MYRLVLPLLLFTSCAGRHVEDEEVVWHDNLPILPKSDEEALTTSNSAAVLYQIKTGKTQEAITTLLEEKRQNPYLLHEGALDTLGLALLEQGASSHNPQDLLSALYGAGISHDERTLVIAERAMASEEPQMQLLAVSVAASFDTDYAMLILEKGMKSNYVFVRLEAAYWLSQKRAKDAYGQLAALLSKLDPQLHELFPRLFAMEGSTHSTQELKRLLFDQNEAVRREAILAIADFEREDLCPEIRLLANDPSFVQQEAAAYALGALGDEDSRQVLQKLSLSKSHTTRLTAHYSLYQLGDDGAKEYLFQEAANGNCFAILLLGSMTSGDEILIDLLDHPEADVRVNASMALLQKRNRYCLDGLLDVLIDSHKDYTYRLISSHGGALRAWKVTPSSSQQLSREPQFFELSLRLREQALVQALELNESDFLKVARAIFLSGQFDLIPLTVRLLENLQSPEAIELLKEQEMCPGVPFIRSWCCLALYRMNQPGPYGQAIRKMVQKHEDKEVFQARPILPWRLRQDDSKYQLTLAQASALLIESYEALAQKQDEQGVEALLESIRDGNVHNRYTLAGLLMRASL